MRVLVVEDNPTNRMITLKVLSRLGVEAISRENGAMAVEACCSEEFDLIFMDCMMPVMDGYDATGLIRGGEPDSKNLKTPVIALTANAMEGDKEKCLQAGMSDYIAKPIRPKDIQAALEKWTPKSCASEQEAASEIVASLGGEELVDLSELIDMFGDSPDELRPIVDAFVGSLTEELTALEGNHGPAFDFAAMRLRSHTIKGASANFGAKPLQKIAKQTEAACIAEEPAEVEALLPELKSLVQRTIVAAKEAVA